MFLETILKWQGFPLDKAKKELYNIQAQKSEQFRKWQLQRRDAIVKYHFEKNEWYKDIVGMLPANWEDIPLLQKKHLQQPIEKLLTKPYQRKDIYVGNTSGSSGHPFYYAKDKMCHALTWMQIKHLYNLHGISLNGHQARFYGIPLAGKSRIIEKSKDWIANRTRFPVFDLSELVLSKWIIKFRNTRFDYLYGYTSSLVYFARYCLEKDLLLKSICPTLKVCIVTSEVCTCEDREILSRGFGLPVINEYGASEAGLIAFEHPDGEWRFSEELLYIELVDERNQPVKPGQTGKLLITALFNKSFPLIRYEIGDMGKWKELADGKRALVDLQGRTNDFVKLPSGKEAPGLTLYYVSRSLLEKSDFIKEFIIIQTALDTFQFRIHAKRPINDEDKALLLQKLEEYLEPGLKLDIQEVEKIERPGSGKIKHFYSELK
jgi:phenylacetate-CoA ligase